MSKLINRLNELQHLSPDEIVMKLSHPFSEWRRGHTMTREEYDQYGHQRVILAGFPRGRVNNNDRYEINRWGHHMWALSWLGEDYYFMSEAIYDQNPHPPTR